MTAATGKRARLCREDISKPSSTFAAVVRCIRRTVHAAAPGIADALPEGTENPMDGQAENESERNIQNAHHRDRHQYRRKRKRSKPLRSAACGRSGDGGRESARQH